MTGASQKLVSIAFISLSSMGRRMIVKNEIMPLRASRIPLNSILCSFFFSSFSSDS